MSVTSTSTSISYITDGVTKIFNIPFYFIQPSDLLVQTIDSSNNVITYKLTTDFTVTGTTNLYGDFNNGGSLNFNTAPGSGLTLLISRVTSRTQSVTLLDGQAYSADTINHMIDKITLLIQEGFIDGYLGLALGPPTIVTGTAKNVGNWLKNSIPSGGGVFGWIVITAGDPGTWRALAPISLT